MCTVSLLGHRRIFALPVLAINASVHLHQCCKRMAKSKFEYVKQFETEDKCLPNVWIVVRVDGKAFHRFSDKHKFKKPNDDRSLMLMTQAAHAVMNDFNDVVIAYGHSDEYSFVFRRQTTTYNRRASKLMTNVVSLFASSYVYNWKSQFGEEPLQYPPTFDSRVILYPTNKNIRDYMSWRQADCHINNMYNTCFWALVQDKGLTARAAEERLKGTLSGEKNELLFSEFNINYNNLPELHRKGTTLVREKQEEKGTKPDGSEFTRKSTKTVTLHVDIIGQQFWRDHPDIITEEPT